jgi:hypothetical protein
MHGGQDLSDDTAADRAADGIAGLAHAQILERRARCRPADRAGDDLHQYVG